MADLVRWTDYMNKFPFGGNQSAIGRQNDHGGMTIYSAPTKTANIFFIDGIDSLAQTNAANFRFNHATDEFQFLIQQLPKASINSAGELTAVKFIGDGSGLSGLPGALDTTDDLPEGITNLYHTNTRVDDRISLQKGASNGLATLGPDSKIPSSQLSSLAVTDTFVVASQVAMLSLVAERGDIAVRTDVNKTFILQSEPATVLGNWVEILTPTGSISSVNGYTGDVLLGTGDISESGLNYYYTESRFNTSFSGKNTDNLVQGSTNKYYSSTLFSTDFNARVAGTTNTLAMFASGNTIGDSPISVSGTMLEFDASALLGKNDNTTLLGGSSNRFASLYIGSLIDYNTGVDFTLAQNGTQRLLIKNTTGNVRIGSGVDNGSKLQIKGTSNSLLNVGDSSGFVDRISITSGASSSDVSLRMSRTSEEMILGLISTIGNISDFSEVGDVVLRANTNNIIFTAHSASGKIKFGTGLSDTKKMELSNGGQLAINEDSNDSLTGFKLLVNGSGRLNSLGIGTTSIGSNVLLVNGTSQLDGRLFLNSTYLDVSGMSAPSVSLANSARIYYDSGTNTLKLSLNGGVYNDFGTGSGSLSGTLTAGKIPKASGVSSLTDSLLSESGSIVSVNGSLSANKINTGGVISSIVTKTTNYNISENDYTIEFDCTTGNLIAVLPFSPQVGQIFNICKIDSSSNFITLDGNGKTINNSSNLSTKVQYYTWGVQYNGTEWRII